MLELLIPCLETICMDSFTDVNLQLFLSDHFKGLILLQNLIFPPLFNAPARR